MSHEHVDGIPVERSEQSGNLVTVRGGWVIRPDSETEVRPGDVIPVGPVLASGDARYIEHLTRYTDGHEIEEGDDLVVEVIDPDEPMYPCTFCSPAGLVAERGIINSDYNLRLPSGELLARTCHACIADAHRW